VGLTADLRGIALCETAGAGWAASLRGSQPPRNLVGIAYSVGLLTYFFGTAESIWGHAFYLRAASLTVSGGANARPANSRPLAAPLVGPLRPCG